MCMSQNAKLLVIALELRPMARQREVGRSATAQESPSPERLIEAAEALEGLVRRSVVEAVQAKLQ